MNEDFYPYIFSEDLYLISGSMATAKPVLDNREVRQPAAEEKRPLLSTLHAGTSPQLSVVFWGKKMDLPAADRELLNKILQACKLNPAEITLTEADTAAGLMFADELPTTKALVFCDTESLRSAKKAEINLYHSKTLSGKSLLFSDGLSALNKDIALKTSLWKSIQAFLEIGA